MADQAIGNWADHDYSDSEEPSSVSGISLSGKATCPPPRKEEYRRRIQQEGTTASESHGTAPGSPAFPEEQHPIYGAHADMTGGTADGYLQPEEDMDDFAIVVKKLIGILDCGLESTAEDARRNPADQSTVAPLKDLFTRLQSMPGTTSEEMLSKLQFLCGSQEERFGELQTHFESKMRASVSTTQFDRWTQLEMEEARKRREYKATLIPAGILAGAATQSSSPLDVQSATMQVGETRSCAQLAETLERQLAQVSVGQPKFVPTPPTSDARGFRQSFRAGVLHGAPEATPQHSRRQFQLCD
jgi:hypothetical protein